MYQKKSSKCCALILVYLIITISSPTFSSENSKYNLEYVEDLSLQELLEMNLEIESVSKHFEKLSASPATVYIVTHEEINLRGYVTLLDVLLDVPGLQVSEVDNSEYGTSVAVRGVTGNNKIITMINGVRTNPPGGERNPIRNEISVSHATRIEIIYGPGSTLYGADAINGIVNIVTLKPTDVSNTELSLIGGATQHREGEASYQKQFSDFGISAHMRYRKADLDDLSETFPDYWNSLYKPTADKLDVLGSSPVRWDEGLNLFLRVNTDNSSLQIVHMGSSRSTGEGGRSSILIYAEDAVWKDASSNLEWSNRLHVTNHTTFHTSLVLAQYQIDTESAFRDKFDGTNYKFGRGRKVSIEEQVVSDINSKTHVVAGVKIATFEVTPKATVNPNFNEEKDWGSQTSSIQYYTALGDTTSLVSIPNLVNINYNSYSAYVEIQRELVKNINLTSGARFDFDTRFDEVPFNPRLAIVWEITEKWTGKMIHTRAYLAPSPYSSYATFATPNFVLVPNQNLKPETAISNELAVSYTDKNLYTTLSAYYNLQEDLIIPGDEKTDVNNTSTVYRVEDETTPIPLYQPVNAGASHSYGVSLFMKLKTQKSLIWGSASFADFESDVNGEISGMRFISKYNIRLGWTYQVLDGLHITPSLILASTPEGVTKKSGLDEELVTPYAVNFSGIYHLFPKLDITLKLKNVTNHKYATGGRDSAIPQEKFKAMLGIKLRI